MKKAKVSIVFVCLFLTTTHAFAKVKVNPIKVYDAGIKAYEANNYKKAISLLEDAIEAGLSGEKLKDSYLKLYFSAFTINDLKKIGYYQAKCESFVPHFRYALSELKETALYLGSSFEGKFYLAETLKAIASALVKAGKPKEADPLFSEALETARSIVGISKKTQALQFISCAFAEAGRIEQALEIARSIGHNRDREFALARISIALADIGEMERALEIARSMKKEGHNGEFALARISIALAVAGEIEQALKIARSIKDSSNKAHALIGIVSALITAGKSKESDPLFLEVLRIVRSIKSPSRARALAKISNALAKAGRTEKANLILSEALEIAKSIEDPVLQSLELWQISSALAEAGKIEQALEIARSIKDKDHQQWALIEIASLLITAGRMEAAFELAKSTNDIIFRKIVLLRVTIQLLSSPMNKNQEAELARKIMTIAHY